MLDIIINENEIRIGQDFAVSFHRTLRIPDDGRVYPLPPGLGLLPVCKVEDYVDRIPSTWREMGGAFIPMYQREALWLGFNTTDWKPNAVKICVGNINAISGEPYTDGLHTDPQDYIVCPDQLWLDGINAGRGSIRQFVAMPLGLGYTIEASITGMEIFGGIQMDVFEPKPGKFQKKPLITPEVRSGRFAGLKSKSSIAQPMGIGAGGMMKQKIYSDKYGINVWDMNNRGHAVVHIVNSAQYYEITGNKPLPTPINPKTYTEHGLPWFGLYEEVQGDVAPSITLAHVKTIVESDKERGVSTTNNQSVDVPEALIKKLYLDNSGH